MSAFDPTLRLPVPLPAILRTGGSAGWPPAPTAARGDGRGGDGTRPPRRRLPFVLAGLAALVAVLAAAIVSSLDRAATGDGRGAVPLLGAPGVAAGVGAGAGRDAGIEVLTESATCALPPSAAGNRFDSGWQRRDAAGRAALVPAPGAAARLQLVNLGEEVARTLTFDLAPATLPAGERISIRTGEREVAQAVAPGGGAPVLRVALPEDLPVGQIPLDLVFSAPPAAGADGSAGAPGRASTAGATGAAAAGRVATLPAVFGAGWSPVLSPGEAHVAANGDVVQSGNCLVYLACRLTGNEALVGAFEPPAAARPGQRFDLAIERPDGTPIRRFHWVPSFWNRLRGTRRFELPLRGAKGPARVRLIARAGEAGGPAARWRGLGLASVKGAILSPGQGQ